MVILAFPVIKMDIYKQYFLNILCAHTSIDIFGFNPFRIRTEIVSEKSVLTTCF